MRNLRWGIAGLLFLSTLINYIDRQTLSVLAPVLRDQFHMSNTDYSRVLFAFLLAYMIMQSGSGRIMDRLGTRRGFSLTIAWWSVAAVLHAAAASVLTFGACRFLLGLGEAGNWPGGVKAVSECSLIYVGWKTATTMPRKSQTLGNPKRVCDVELRQFLENGRREP